MRRSTESARGFGLAEMLVSLAVLLLALVAALVLYENLRRVFHLGENAAENQQSVRAALDHVVADLRLAGFNLNPDGDPGRPDEAIEAAHDTAIVVRGDFDATDPVAADVPEAVLAGGAFETVSTGNDEIVAYALAKPDRTGPDTLVFEADVLEAVRDGDLETVRIADVALIHDDPPYTLYRITLNDPSTLGGGRFIVRVPVADNIRSMTFRYYDRSGSLLHGGDPATVADDIGGGETGGAPSLRARVRRIGLTIEGMDRDPDPATRSHRKFTLAGEVTPRNLDRLGRIDP